MKGSKKQTIKPGKVRDFVTMREITHGTGVGGHKSDKDYNRKAQKNELRKMMKEV